MNETTGITLVRDDEDIDYTALVRLRRGLGDLYTFLQDVSGQQGCTPSMYQLLLAVRTSRCGGSVDIGMLAAALGVRHPSAAEMVRKAESAGFVRLTSDEADGRRVLVDLTYEGSSTLETVARSHREELRRVRTGFIAALRALD